MELYSVVALALRRKRTIVRHDPEADSGIIVLSHPKVISVERIMSMSGRTVAGKEKLRGYRRALRAA
jgi:hypothetical protein